MCARRRPGCAAVPSRVLGAFPRSLDAQLLVTGFDSPGKFVNECLYLFFDFFFSAVAAIFGEGDSSL